MISLLENEQIITVVRKHWFVVLGEFLGIFVAMIAPLFLFFVIEFVPLNVINSSFSSGHVINVLYFFYFFWILIWWMSAFYIWTDYYLDEWFITNQRIINIEQRGLFEREMGSLRFDSIQNVSVEIPGIIATMLKIGNLQVETAGERTVFLIKNVAKAEESKQIISRLCKDASDQFKVGNEGVDTTKQV